ncbi:btb (poz) domain-containing 2a-related [Anaeramoeba flamelloides]|uniref:Btb (Poz) domain-containing 2a-related n=1 Tax=Anaeramoeba flamelloides TaxID=1746091 RepID=A0ABQ8Y527_9EUKA|nr:btb (poz) domain-containing 2a-related [Anaeramoeba flamelloides]
MEEDQWDLEKDLSQCLNKSKCADLRFVVGKDKDIFYAHKLLVSISCPYWRKVFYFKDWQSMRRSKFIDVLVPEIESNLFCQFLEFVYLRKANITHENIFGLQELSVKYEMPELDEYCSKSVYSCLSFHNCLNFYEKTKQLGLVKWSETILKYIEKNSASIINNQNCLVSLKKETVHEILSLQKLYVPEIVLFRSLINWAKNNQQTNSKHSQEFTLKRILRGFLQHIRLDLLDFPDIEEIRNYDLFSDQELFRTAIGLAKKNSFQLPTKTRADNLIVTLDHNK